MIFDIIFKVFLGVWIIALAVKAYRTPEATNARWFPWLAKRTWGARGLRMMAAFWVFAAIVIVTRGLAPLIFYGADSRSRIIAAAIIAVIELSWYFAATNDIAPLSRH